MLHNCVRDDDRARRGYQAHWPISLERMRRGRRSTASFSGLAAASLRASETKRRNRATGSRHERILQTTLWQLGLRYRKHRSDLAGKPDLVFSPARVVVFCDGDFWHGRKWKQSRAKLSRGHNGRYWVDKIAGNRSRDRRVNSVLRRQGWLVIRVWETDIRKDAVRVASRIRKTVLSRLLAAE